MSGQVIEAGSWLVAQVGIICKMEEPNTHWMGQGSSSHDFE